MNDTVKTPKLRKCLVSLAQPHKSVHRSDHGWRSICDYIIAASFAIGRFAFSIAAIIASFTSAENTTKLARLLVDFDQNQSADKRT